MFPIRRALVLAACTGLLAVLFAPPAASDDDAALKAAALKKVRALQAERIALADRLAPAVCAVFRGGGGGSGVIITEDGLVLSNFHVTEMASKLRIGLNDHKIHQAVVIGVDPSGDLALLKLVEKRKWTYSPLGDSDALEQGDWVYAMGNPFLLATDFTPTVTLGVVSNRNCYQPGSIRGTLLYPDCVQTDASINPGNSGGPLFNFQGEVIGINGRVSLRERGRVNIGVGYAISSNQIKHCLPDMRAGHVVQHGTLNANVKDLEDPNWKGGVRVTFFEVLSPGAAANAGINVGDALISFNGVPIRETNQFVRLISVLPKGRRVTLEIASLRDGEWTPRTLRINLDGIPLVKKSVLARRKPPQLYIRAEIERTLRAAREAMRPIQGEIRTGKLTVRGRTPKRLREEYTDKGHTIRIGSREIVVTDAGGTDGGKPIEPERREDMLERLNGINELLAEESTAAFKEITFPGGWVVGNQTVDKLEVTAKNGKKRIYYVKLETGRLLRMDLYSQQWVRWISLFFTDWRKVDGLLRPYRVEIWDREKERLLQTLEYQNIRKSS